MADVAHDASGPDSPKPGGIALQQASRPDTPDGGKLRVFISYSRNDLNFADQLKAALDAWGFECSIDRHGISGGEEWKRRLGNLISESDTIVFVLSPTSARSKICIWEVEKAERLGKRILPANCRPLKGASPPPQLRDRNYIFFHENSKEPGAGFGTGLAKLIAALNTDFDWLREHTRYLQRATEWDRGGRPANRLLSGNDIAEAKAWAARRPKSAPEPTALHLDFIRASEEEADARSSAQRKQLDAMAAAQAERETALHEREEAQKRAEDALSRALTIISELQDHMDIDTQKEAFAVFQMGAEHGNVPSMRNLGIAYLRGVGGAQDYAKAREWFEKAVAKGDAPAMANLGLLYHEGYGGAQDYAKAREWYEKAVTKGASNCDKRIGGERREVVPGEALAMRNLGQLYDNGLGVAQDYAMAREWYERAAAKGDATAMYALGILYAIGRGVAQDYAMAREWYERAAAKGDATAMYALGILYAIGRGVAQDYAKAREWFEKAVAKGDAPAMANLGLLYHEGYGGAQDYAKAREWYEKAVTKGASNCDKRIGGERREIVPGEALAMRNLGQLYDNGLGVAQDYAMAREWYERAAANGDATAKADLEKLPIREAAGSGRYAEALQLQEALAAKIEAAETKREGKPGKETAQALSDMAWSALLAREFTKALTIAERADRLLSDDLAIEINLAHALMFQGLGEKASALYLAHKGKPATLDGELWERVIVEDFAEFRKARLTHPMMADIEKELGDSR